MPYELEDAAGWNALPTASSDEQEESGANSIGPLHTGNEPYTYCSPSFAGEKLTLVSQPEKVTSELPSLGHTLSAAGRRRHCDSTGAQLPDLAFCIVPIYLCCRSVSATARVLEGQPLATNKLLLQIEGSVLFMLR